MAFVSHSRHLVGMGLKGLGGILRQAGVTWENQEAGHGIFVNVE